MHESLRHQGAHTATMGVSPPHSSGSSPFSLISCFTLSMLAPSLSICSSGAPVSILSRHPFHRAATACAKSQTLSQHARPAEGKNDRLHSGVASKIVRAPC